MLRHSNVAITSSIFPQATINRARGTHTTLNASPYDSQEIHHVAGKPLVNVSTVSMGSNELFEASEWCDCAIVIAA